MLKLSHWAIQLISVVLIATLGPIAHFAATKAPSSTPSDIDAFGDRWSLRIPELMDEHSIEGAAIVVLVRGEPVWSEMFGFADVRADKPMKRSDLMMAHSISKSVTAWGVMRLVHEGKLDLDAPISRYLDDEKLRATYPLDEMTTRHLVSMNSGVPLGTLGEHLEPGQTRPDLIQQLADQSGGRRTPGSGFEYSNLSFRFLELIVQEISGRDFAVYMRDEILRPIGMHDSGFEWQSDWQGRVPLGYDLEGEAIPAYLYPGRASGGLFATLDDLARFAAASIDHDGAILTDEEIAEMHRPHTSISGLFAVVADHYGLGHFIERLDGEQAVWHGGQGLGWMTHFYVVPATGDGIVIVSNSQKGWPFFAVLLEEWSTWANLPSPGMALISKGTLGVRILISLLLLVSSWVISRILWRVHRGSREFGPARPDAPRIISGVAALALTLGLVWAITRDYLFVSSIFPQETPWLFAGLVGTTAALALSAITTPKPSRT